MIVETILLKNPLFIKATLVSAILMASVQKLQIDLKVCQKLEMNTNREYEECIKEDDACSAALMECNMRLQERQDEINSEEDIGKYITNTIIFNHISMIIY